MIGYMENVTIERWVNMEATNTILPDLRNDADVIGEFLRYIDENNTIRSYANRYTQRDGSEFLIIDAYGNFMKDFNDWARNSEYYERLVEETRHDCLDDECWWIEYLTEDNYGYDDQYMSCECGNVICYNPSSGYKDNYWMSGCGVMCEDCIRENAEDYIQEYLTINYEKGVPTSNLPINNVFDKGELEDFGFELVMDNLEIGWYGTYNDPREILEKLTKENKDTDYICHCTASNPFATYYEIWARNTLTE